MSFWNNDKYLSGLLTDDELEPTEPPKPTVKVQTNGLYSTSGIGAFDVDVPQGLVPSGTLPITENGPYDVTEYASVNVDVPRGITPSGSITLTEENTYDVTSKASVIVDFSATRANLAEAITAKGVDTLPTSSFDTIATNIGLISGGGGLEKIGTATTNVVSSFGTTYGEISIPANDGVFLLTNPSVAPNSTNRLPKAMLVVITTSPVATTMTCIAFNNGASSTGPSSNVKQEGGYAYINGIGASRFNTACTYDLYKV